MKKLRLFIMAITTVLFISCGAWNPPTDRAEYDFYNNNYNYNQIYRIYLNSPTWFYDNYYLDMYGNIRYYNRHPYYIRFQREHIRRDRTNRQVRSNSTRHINTTRGVTRTTTRVPMIDTPNTRPMRNNRTNAIKQNNNRVIKRNTPTRTVRSNDKSTIRRNNNQVIKRSPPTRTKTSSVKRRN